MGNVTPRQIVLVLAVVAFVLTAIIGFGGLDDWADDWGGWLSVGLACVAAALYLDRAP